MNPSIPYFEVSAKTGEGINEAFDYSLQQLLKPQSSSISVTANALWESKKYWIIAGGIGLLSLLAVLIIYMANANN